MSREYEVRVERAAQRALASVRASVDRSRLGAEIIRLLNLVWPVLREQGVRTGHNVVVYHGGDTATLAVEAGVETFSDFEDRGEVRRSATPAGEIATTAHHGEYSEMQGAYQALERWCRDNGRRRSGVSWEVYGDWDDDPTKRRTDIVFLLESP